MLLNRKIILFLLGLFLLPSCGASPKFTSDKEKPISEKNNDAHGRYSTNGEKAEAGSNSELELRDVAPAAVEIGVASYYGKEFDGRITYNGEVYDMYGISAAHPSYPMGSLIRVTNLDNNKSVELIINDRMPYRPDRIIDLSYGAAKELDFLDEGLAKVKIEVLKWGKGR